MAATNPRQPRRKVAYAFARMCRDAAMIVLSPVGFQVLQRAYLHNFMHISKKLLVGLPPSANRSAAVAQPAASAAGMSRKPAKCRSAHRAPLGQPHKNTLLLALKWYAQKPHYARPTDKTMLYNE